MINAMSFVGSLPPDKIPAVDTNADASTQMFTAGLGELRAAALSQSFDDDSSDGEIAQGGASAAEAAYRSFLAQRVAQGAASVAMSDPDNVLLPSADSTFAELGEHLQAFTAEPRL